LSSAPQDGGQVNQAAPRPNIRGFDFGAAAVFDAQIIQPRVAFDDGFRKAQGKELSGFPRVVLGTGVLTQSILSRSKWYGIQENELLKDIDPGLGFHSMAGE